MQFDVPVNDSAIHVTNINSPLPPFFALSTDNKYSLNLKTEDLASCSGAPVRTSSLHLAWPDFHLRETQTGDRINLPHQVSLTRVQTIRMKAALRTTPSVHLLVANGRRTVFLTPTPPDARNRELPSCPSYTD